MAGADATLQGFFGTNPFRWFYLQLPPGYIEKVPGTCATVQRVSTQYLHAQEAISKLSKPRFQIVVRDPLPDVAAQAATAIINWLCTVDFASDAQFTSPPTTPRQFPNFVTNVRPGLDAALKPPIPSVMVEFQSWNLGVI